MTVNINKGTLTTNNSQKLGSGISNIQVNNLNIGGEGVLIFPTLIGGGLYGGSRGSRGGLRRRVPVLHLI